MLNELSANKSVIQIKSIYPHSECLNYSVFESDRHQYNLEYFKTVCTIASTIQLVPPLSTLSQP